MTSPEKQRTLEVTEDAAITSLREHADQPLKDCAEYLQWMDQEIAKNDSIPNADERVRANFDLIVRDARLRARAGRIPSARNAYEDAILYAKQVLHDEKIVATLEKEMTALA